VFPEYQDLISRLRTEDEHFAQLFERHNDLDQQIRNMEAGIVPADGMHIEHLKKEKLQLKDSLYLILRKASNA
jgi:uncharacterized protein